METRITRIAGDILSQLRRISRMESRLAQNGFQITQNGSWIAQIMEGLISRCQEFMDGVFLLGYK